MYKAKQAGKNGYHIFDGEKEENEYQPNDSVKGAIIYIYHPVFMPEESWKNNTKA